MIKKSYTDIKRVSTAFALKILNQSEFHHSPFNGEDLTHEILKKTDMIPRYEINVHDGKVWFSDIFFLVDNRTAVLAYVQPKGERIVVRSYYPSKSQGVLRFLADYTLSNNLFDWYAKGHEHEHITACIAMQKAFAKLEEITLPRYVDHYNLIFAGTSRERKPDDPPYRGSSGEPEPVNGNFYPKIKKRIPPEELTFYNKEESPDFSICIDHWQKKTPVYGTIDIEVFPSHNKVYYYMFCRDKHNRAWIGMIEKNTGEFKSTGIIKPWVIAGDLITPAYEYPALAYGYGNTALKKGPYIDMFKTYLSKVPIIKEYLSHYSSKH